MSEEELLRARDVLAHRWADGGRPEGDPPEGVVLCHQAGLLGNAISRWRARRLNGFSGDVRVLRRTHGRIAVATQMGVGAPAAVALLEELAAFGTRRFISIGIAGGLRDGLLAGDLVVVERALCGDGTSTSYGASGVVETSAPLSLKLVQALQRGGHAHLAGAACSTDAPYRTTRGLVERWVREGGIAVEMEAAGLLAAARLRGVELTAACCIADGLSASGWRLDFDRTVLSASMRRLFDAAVSALE